MADIVSTFQQVRVARVNVDLLMVSMVAQWSYNPNVGGYQDVNLFDATSSPSCANFALRKCADNKRQFSYEVADELLYCFDVDDSLLSVTREEEAIRLSYDLISICSNGGFKFTKWIINSNCDDQISKGSNSKKA